MAVELDRIPAQADRPSSPKLWLWLCLLSLFLLCGCAVVVLLSEVDLREQSDAVWGAALGASFLGWSLVCGLRVLYYLTRQHSADGWDAARAADLEGKLSQGRRLQQVLAVSVYTALRTEQSDALLQVDAVLEGTNALKAQPSRSAGGTVRHSRLPGDVNENPERALLRILKDLLSDFAIQLAELPDDLELALSLVIDSPLLEDRLGGVWQTALAESGIRQTVTLISWRGLEAIDQWLDQRSDDQALLLVVSVVLAPDAPQGTAETAVGLLLGNPGSQRELLPVANLHRPEQAHGESAGALIRATQLALSWASLPASGVEHLWRSGIGRKYHAAVTTVISEIKLPRRADRKVHDLDALLGHPGAAAPWVAVALAAQTVQRGCGPQLILSGVRCANAPLWVAVLTPVPPPMT
ncbi:hypothetical protein [Pseudomonas sp.]|uniref:hypothetical protein n=1 Tax=Pseudomonas sp. TaxID=306 RepID=UPI0028AAC6FD|nr:hypothetical protein [Pseudomonas sp.]